MNNKIKTLGIVLLAVIAVAALGAGVAIAQTPTPTTGFGPGWMMGGNTQNSAGYSMMGGRGGMMGGFTQDSDSWEWMNAMHQWMAASGGMHTFVWDALAEKLSLTSDELYAEVNSGKAITQIAEEKGVSRDNLVTALETAHEDALAQAVADGYLTQEQADNILTKMSGRYEWMIDNMSNGYGMMGGRGGMMGGYYGQQGANGQFGSGGCHGNWNGSTVDQQPKP